jgi:uncharacterized phage-associated protein
MVNLYNAKTIAHHLLALGRRDGIPIDPLKLQKLVYLAHGWSLVFLKRPLILDPIEAWRYGPVVPTLYHDFRKFGASPITEYPQTTESAPLDEQAKSLLETVWQRYRSLSPIQLSMLTHEPGYAWDLARRDTDSAPWGGPTIPDSLIEDEFVRRQRQAA